MHLSVPPPSAGIVRSFNVLGVRISALTMSETVAEIDRWIQGRERRYVCVCTAHSVTEARRNPAYRAVLNCAGMATPDGMPLVWLGRRAGHPGVGRVYGPDLMLAVCEHGIGRGYRHYFYGGAPGVPERLTNRLTSRCPGLRIVGSESPPFRPLSAAETDGMVARINAARPDIVWVGLGVPKQDFWMAVHRDRLEAPVLIGIGAAFDFHAGLKSQAPRWMQERGLEWLFRLVHEPRRLWYRYLVLGPLFCFHVLLQLSGLRSYNDACDTAKPNDIFEIE